MMNAPAPSTSALPHPRPERERAREGTRAALGRPPARGVAIVAAVHALACVLVLALGFDHVSDDDFARVTIAQSFAHAPKLDPSGTSWLPFPFWALGSVMVVAGRSLAVARVASIAFASLAAVLPYVALRMTGASRRAAHRSRWRSRTLSPWSLWLGAATVPESFTASFTAAAAIALGSPRGPRLRAASTRSGFALALLAACLSRYEPWPVAAVLAIVLAVRGVRGAPGGTAKATISSSPRSSPSDRSSGWRGMPTLTATRCTSSSAWPASSARSARERPDTVERAAPLPSPLRDASSRRWSLALALALVARAHALRDVARRGARRMARPARLRRRARSSSSPTATLATARPRIMPSARCSASSFLTATFAADVLVARRPRRARARPRPGARASPRLVLVAWLANDVVALGDVPGRGPDRGPNEPSSPRATALRAENVEHARAHAVRLRALRAHRRVRRAREVAILPRSDARRSRRRAPPSSDGDMVAPMQPRAARYGPFARTTPMRPISRPTRCSFACARSACGSPTRTRSASTSAASSSTRRASRWRCSTRSRRRARERGPRLRRERRRRGAARGAGPASRTWCATACSSCPRSAPRSARAAGCARRSTC